MPGPRTSPTPTPRPSASRRSRLAAGAVVGALTTAAVAAPTPALAAAVDIATFCAAAPDASRFHDAGGFFAAEIACLEATGITRGVTPTQYAPDRTVTRAEMASFVVRLVDTAMALQAIELNALPERGGARFTDVPTGSAHAEAVARLAEAGIVQGGAGGRPTDQFAPDLPVNRAQMATMLAGTYAWLTGEEIGPDGDAFADVETLDPQVQIDINVLATAGVTTGVSQGRYAPADPVRRGQMAAFLTRVLAVLEAADFVEPLRPVRLGAELVQLNRSGASGTAVVTGLGGEVTVTVTASGVSPTHGHLQHIHLGGTHTCPTVAADSDGDGFVSVGEGVPAYGAVAVSLTVTGDVGADVRPGEGHFPGGGDEGRYTYERRFALPAGLVVSDLADGVVVVHGITDTPFGQDPTSYDGSGSGVPTEMTLPAACGALEFRTGG